MAILISLVYNYSGKWLCALGRTGRITPCCGIAEFSTRRPSHSCNWFALDLRIGSALETGWAIMNFHWGRWHQLSVHSLLFSCDYVDQAICRWLTISLVLGNTMAAPSATVIFLSLMIIKAHPCLWCSHNSCRHLNWGEDTLQSQNCYQGRRGILEHAEDKQSWSHCYSWILSLQG